jgi:hypothetical protein
VISPEEEAAMSMSRSTHRVAVAAAAMLSVLLVLMGTASSHAEATCHSVDGTYREQDASGPGCTSPVGLCITGRYQGDITGPFAGQATALLPTADTPTTGVILFTSDSTIDARVGHRTGTLIIKNSGAFRTIADGSIVDLQTIVGGTGDFTGATGALRAEGTFTTADGGRSRYTGTICVG